MASLIPTDPKQRNMMVAALVFLAGFYLFYSYWYSGKREEVAAIQQHVDNLDAQNRRARLIEARGGADLEERTALYERHVARLEELIPGAEEVPALLNSLQERARATGVEQNRMVPEGEQVGAFYTRTSYEMAVIGEYHDVARFLTEIASLTRIVTAIDMDIQKFDQVQLFPDYESPILASFRIETFILPDATPSVPTGAGPQAGPGQAGGLSPVPITGPAVPDVGE
ncbi:MAG: type 4a pilus biogenesis protein PilO [Gemmatimonadota bacterium]|nr:type 4a pilus biogenesis protein PilO [Gemmatimonadota bacterium]MDH5758838.1 type 4a pilus biogenesis protein PilO [Gemmatimonadota bacterium]